MLFSAAAGASQLQDVVPGYHHTHRNLLPSNHPVLEQRMHHVSTLLEGVSVFDNRCAGPSLSRPAGAPGETLVVPGNI